LPEKYADQEDLSRKGAKRKENPLETRSALRLCAFARKIFSEKMLSGKAHQTRSGS
jgi:hypothetical protein